MKKKRHNPECSITIDNIINDALINLKEIVDANTVVGNEIKTKDGTVIIPISKVLVGFVAGGGEYEDQKQQSKCYPFAGGSGAGFTVVPIGFLTVKNDTLSFISAKSDTKYDELINLTNKSLKMILDNFSVKKDEK